jgi:transposase
MQIAKLSVELKRQGADHRYIPLLVTCPGVGWINGYTIASEIGDINRFPSPAKLCLHRPLPARLPIRQLGPARPDLEERFALSALGAVRGGAARLQPPVYRERYQRTKKRLGKQRGPKVAQIDLSRKLTEAIWHMLTRNQPFAPAGAAFRLAT